MRKTMWIAASVALALTGPVSAQLPGIDAPTGAGVGSKAPGGTNKPGTIGKRAEPATPSDIAPRDGAAASPGREPIGDAARRDAQRNPRPMGSTASKMEGSEPVDSGIGRSAPDAAGGAMTGGGRTVR